MTHSGEVVLGQNTQNTKHVHITIVDVGLLIVRGLAVNIPQVNIRYSLLGAVSVYGIVDIAVRHLGERSHAAFELI